MDIIVSIWASPEITVKKEITAIIKDFSKKYKAYTAVKDYKGPHITIINLKIPKTEFDSIFENVKAISLPTKKFKIQINGIGYFTAYHSGSPNYVIYFKILKTQDLSKLYRRLKKRFKAQLFGYPKFTPHITLTMRDLTRTDFYLALKDFKHLKFSRRITIKKIMVSYKDNHSGKAIVKTVKLTK